MFPAFALVKSEKLQPFHCFNSGNLSYFICLISAQCLWHSLPKSDIGDPAAREVEGQKGLQDNGSKLHKLYKLHKENSHDCIIDLLARLSLNYLLRNQPYFFLPNTAASMPILGISNFLASGNRGSPGLSNGLPPPPSGRLGLRLDAGRRRCWT